MKLDQLPLDTLFYKARTINAFTNQTVSTELLKELYELTKWAPTSMNCQPARFVFIQSQEAKQRLAPCMSPGNLDKTMQAPVTVLIASDTQFYEHLAQQFPVMPEANKIFESNAQLSQDTAFRNSSLQGAYLIMAARALGLDAGPMSGFDVDKVNTEFFPDGRHKINFMVNLGYADHSATYPRGPRLSVEQATQFL